jgi:hypothetical protein
LHGNFKFIFTKITNQKLLNDVFSKIQIQEIDGNLKCFKNKYGKAKRKFSNIKNEKNARDFKHLPFCLTFGNLKFFKNKALNFSCYFSKNGEKDYRNFQFTSRFQCAGILKNI